jgi:predicted N-acetyltransferase YhbS
VHPKHQKRGLGSLLMRDCMEIADAAGLPIYLAFFSGAHPLYLRLGFKDLKYSDVDLGEWARSKGVTRFIDPMSC